VHDDLRADDARPARLVAAERNQFRDRAASVCDDDLLTLANASK
jgi:hypothetical protein